MGGRGGNSGFSSNEKPVSKLIAKVYFNSAKKSDALKGSGTVKRDNKLENVIKSEKTDYFKSITTKKEALRVAEYIQDRLNESARNIAKLGSAEAVFQDQKAAIEHRKLTAASNAMRTEMKRFSQPVTNGNTSAAHDTSRTTTTYDRSRKRRIQNFNAWFGLNK